MKVGALGVNPETLASIKALIAFPGVYRLIGASARLSPKNLPCPSTKYSPHAKLFTSTKEASLSSVNAT